MLWWGARSDRLLDRRWHLLIPSAVAVLALVISAVTNVPALKMTALTFAGFGAFANLPVFWALTSAMLPESDAPAGIAMVSSIGNIGGFAAPYLVGALRQASGTFTSGTLALAGFVALTTVVAAIMVRSRGGKEHSDNSVSSLP
jgi:nitrate/nitrite transporter NarK